MENRIKDMILYARKQRELRKRIEKKNFRAAQNALTDEAVIKYRLHLLHQDMAKRYCCPRHISLESVLRSSLSFYQILPEQYLPQMKLNN